MENPGEEHNFTPFTDALLHKLNRSKENGSVIAIWAKAALPFRDIVLLTAVENIIDVEIVNDKLIILKKTDLRGIPITRNQIYLKEIEKVISFTASYNEHFLLLAKDKTPAGQGFLIKQREQLITLDDLKIILVMNINSGTRISIKISNEDSVEDSVKVCYLLDISPDGEELILSCNLNGDSPEQLSIGKIESLEFEFNFYYRAFSSKIFKIKKH